MPDIYAIGDCAAHVNAFANGARIRLESVQNANDQADTVVRSLCGRPTPYCSVPSFWSDQYDLKLQSIGVSAGHEVALVRGEPQTRSFSVIYATSGRVIALDCVNATRDFVRGRKLVLDRTRVNPQVLTAGTPLQDLSELLPPLPLAVASA
ncbi:MAG: hypothetical protein HC872_02065 [Gammaproteobacteria bacterium]|nr:hypothetical protein [Gammaproteobacteria bacterium]